MGYAFAAAAKKAGHKVTLISASDLQPPVGINFVGVDSAAEMFAAVKKFFIKCDCLIMAAAVSDYTPAKKLKTKIQKSNRNLVVRLKPTADILKWAGGHKRKNQIVVGFALEDKNLRRNAEKKLKEKNLDMIIANTPAEIGCDSSAVQVKTPGQPWLKLPRTTKVKIAERIVNLLTC